MIPMDGDGLCLLILMTGVVFGLGWCTGVMFCEKDNNTRKHKTIELTTQTKDIEAISVGEKNFLLLRDTDDIQVGDKIVMKEHDCREYTGYTAHRTVKYVLRDAKDGLKKEYCIIGF